METLEQTDGGAALFRPGEEVFTLNISAITLFTSLLTMNVKGKLNNI
jgi:hypothetical protein